MRWKHEMHALERGHKNGSSYDVGGNIYVEHCGSVAELWTLIEKKTLLYLRRGVRLIVIDSIAALFRAEFDHDMSIARAAELKRLGRRLKQLSHLWRAAIVCVNQVNNFNFAGQFNFQLYGRQSQLGSQVRFEIRIVLCSPCSRFVSSRCHRYK